MRSFKTHWNASVHSTLENVYSCFLNGDPTKFYTGFGPVPACVGIEDQSPDWPVIGAARRIISADNHSSIETIVDLKAYTDIKLVTNQFSNRHFDFVNRMECDVHLVARSNSETVVDWTYTFVSSRSHFKARILATAIFPPALKRAMHHLKYYSETGLYE